MMIQKLDKISEVTIKAVQEYESIVPAGLYPSEKIELHEIIESALREYGGTYYEEWKKQQKEIERLKAEKDELAKGILRQGEALGYIKGIYEKGTGVPTSPDDVIADRMLEYVKSLEVIRTKFNGLVGELKAFSDCSMDDENEAKRVQSILNKYTGE